MKKCRFIIMILVLMICIVFISGCSLKIKEKDLVGTTWEYLDEKLINDPEYSSYMYIGNRYEFYEGNVGKYSTISKVDGTNGHSWNVTYKIEKDYISIFYSDGELINKYKINESKNKFVSISEEEVFILVE